MIKDNLMQVISLQDYSKEILVIYIKPKSKNKVIEYDSDTVAFDIVEDKLLFDFWDIEGFEIKIDKIKEVRFKKFDDNMKIAYVVLKNGNTIMIHLMN